MPLIRTSKALNALSHPSNPLNPRQRTLLLLANGQRSTAQLNALMGEDVQTLLQALQAEDYLAPAPAGEPLPHDPPGLPSAPEPLRQGAFAAVARAYLGRIASCAMSPLPAFPQTATTSV